MSPLPFAAFRIAFGSVMIAEIVQMIEFRRLLFDSIPYRDSHPVLGALLWIWLVSAVFLVLGWKTRLAALLTYALAVTFLGFDAMTRGYEYHHDALIIPALAIFAFLPSGRSLSLDSSMARARAAFEEGRPRPPAGSVTVWSCVLPVLVLGTTYADSVIAKLGSTLWRTVSACGRRLRFHSPPGGTCLRCSGTSG